MRVSFPHSISNYKTALGQSNRFGAYPVGTHNTWHGGLHIEGEKEIKAIADGRIIAYRFNNKYIVEDVDGKKIPYSNGFILMQHTYKLARPVPSKEDFTFTFYSLYHHLMSKEEMESKNIVPELYNKKTFKVKAENKIKGLKAHAGKKYYDDVKLIIPKGHKVQLNTNFTEEEKKTTHWSKVKKGRNYVKVNYTDPVSKKFYDNLYVYKGETKPGDKGSLIIQKESNTDENSKKGARIYDKPNGAFVKIVETNSSIEVDSSSLKNGWYTLKGGGCVRDEDVFFETSFKSDIELDTIANVDLENVKAGTAIGHAGKYGAAKQEDYRACHVEIFSADDPNEFLSGSYHMSKKATHFKIAKGASLQTNIIENISIDKNTPIEILEIDDNFCQIQVRKPKEKVLYAHLIDNYDKGLKHYKIKENNFDDVNTVFGGCLSKDSKLYYDGGVGTNERNAIYKPKHHGSKFWVKIDAVKQLATKELPKKGDKLNTTVAISEYYLVKPNKAETLVNTEKEIITPIGSLKHKKANDGKHWYFIEVSNALKPQEGWIKSDHTSVKKISAHNWKEFGFEALDAGSDYVYSVKEVLEAKETNPFINKIWGKVDVNKDKQLSASEWRVAFRRPEIVESFSKLVCKHANEWSYETNTICSDAEQFFDIGINLEEREKEKQELQKRKEAHIDALRLRVDNLSFWKDIKPGDTTTKQKRKETFLAAKPPDIIRYNKLSCLPDELRLKTDYEKKLDKEFEDLEQERIPRKFPSSNEVWHFHPIAFVEHMKLITGIINWRPPIDNPMLCLYSQGGKSKKPWHGSFGKKIRDGVSNHTGSDLLATPGTKVYASIKSKIVRTYTSTSMAGNTIITKVLDVETFKALRKEYNPLYSHKGELTDMNFNYDGPFYLVFFHLEKMDFFKAGDIVEPNDVIGLTGVSGKKGKKFDTCNPHLHFEINNKPRKGLEGKCNPSMYFDFKSEKDLTQEEINYQEKLKRKEWD